MDFQAEGTITPSAALLTLKFLVCSAGKRATSGTLHARCATANHLLMTYILLRSILCAPPSTTTVRNVVQFDFDHKLRF